MEIGGDITPGVYGLTVDPSTSKQAQMPITVPADGDVITKDQEGYLIVNDFFIKIEEGMTGVQINELIRDSVSKIGMEYDSADHDTGIWKKAVYHN